MLGLKTLSFVRFASGALGTLDFGHWLIWTEAKRRAPCMGNLSWPTFYLACLENKGQVRRFGVPSQRAKSKDRP